MAVTVLMHMKEEKEFPSAHLYSTINYVLDVAHDGAKTDYGMWVGGNSGIEAPDVYHQFMETKKLWQKEHGRQGYHFVISFEEGEADAAKCYLVAKEFCEKFLGDNYDYVFAVHKDKKHMHAHIVFNSVSRTTGLKYHYKNGDWKKYIQPITDEICVTHGLPELRFKEKTTGVSYADWRSRKTGDLNWTDIIRADIDLAISNADNLEDFYRLMGKMGYTIDPGHSRLRGRYWTFIYTDEKGTKHSRRSYYKAYGTEYSPERIEERIYQKEMVQPYYEEITKRLTNKVNVHLPHAETVKHTRVYGRLYQAVNYYKLPNPFAVPHYQVRKDMQRINYLIEECKYIKDSSLTSYDALNHRHGNVEERLHQLYLERKHLKRMEEDFKLVVPADTINRYRQLQRKLSEAREWDETLEYDADELEELEKVLPVSVLENETKLVRCENNIELLKKERRILNRIIKTEGGKGIYEQMSKEVKTTKIL